MKKKDRLVPCWIHIPCQWPDGTEIDAEKINEFLGWFDRQFGGSTVLGVVPGSWCSPEGEIVKEPMLRVEVAVKQSELKTFEAIGHRIRKETKQQAIYTVINPQAEVRLLWEEGEDDGQLSANA